MATLLLVFSPFNQKMESVFSPLASGLGSSLDLTKDTKGEVILCPFKAYTLRKPAFLCNFSWRYSKPGLDCCRMKGKAQPEASLEEPVLL